VHGRTVKALPGQKNVKIRCRTWYLFDTDVAFLYIQIVIILKKRKKCDGNLIWCG
jgi:hypothetical protein